MVGSEEVLHVYRDSWIPEHVALLCGIANAGGGALLIASGSSSRARDMKRLRKPFEQIPQIAQRELGIACTTQPLLDGALLRLEITVPGAPAEQPLRYNGIYRFYDKESERNLSLSLAEIKERRLALARTDLSATQERGSLPQDGFKTAQDLVDAFGELVRNLATSIEGTVVEQEGNSFIINFPDEKNIGAGVGADVSAAPAQRKGKIGIRDIDPNSKEFSSRSLAAANRISLTSTDEYVLSVLHANGRATASHIAELLGVSESTARRSFKKLKEKCLIERIGSNKAGYWRVLD